MFAYLTSSHMRLMPLDHGAHLRALANDPPLSVLPGEQQPRQTVRYSPGICVPFKAGLPALVFPLDLQVFPV